jgi:hypothetical protein
LERKKVLVEPRAATRRREADIWERGKERAACWLRSQGRAGEDGPLLRFWEGKSTGCGLLASNDLSATAFSLWCFPLLPEAPCLPEALIFGGHFQFAKIIGQSTAELWLADATAPATHMLDIILSAIERHWESQHKLPLPLPGSDLTSPPLACSQRGCGAEKG